MNNRKLDNVILVMVCSFLLILFTTVTFGGSQYTGRVMSSLNLEPTYKGCER